MDHVKWPRAGTGPNPGSSDQEWVANDLDQGRAGMSDPRLDGID
jgi:hypothetical protein